MVISMRGYTLFGLSSQPSISASIHNATIEIAIADFFHCENIPDAVVESPRFTRLVKVCPLVGDDFVVPNCKKVGGELLDINYENTYSLNKAELIKEAKVFGFAWMGNGATIHKMLLLKILALNGSTALMTVSIHDCTKHLEEGGENSDTIEKVVTHLHVPPCPTPNYNAHTVLPHEIIDTF